jgi:hypothetical protein
LHLNQNKNNDILPYISSVDIIFIYTWVVRFYLH